MAVVRSRALRLAMVAVLMVVSCHGYGRRRQKWGPTVEQKPEKPEKPEKPWRECSVTKGSSLTSFLDAKAHTYVPCRYILGEFYCHKDTKIIAQNAFGSDGHPYVYGVTVRKSREWKDDDGNIVEDIDQAAVNMTDLKAFLEKGKLHKTHWRSSGSALYWNGRAKNRLQGKYDNATGQTHLSDGSGLIDVYLTYVDPTSDRSSKGNLTVICSTHADMDEFESRGYLCGTISHDSEAKLSKGHLQAAAKAVRLDVDDYVAYHVLVEQKVEQSNKFCRQSSYVLRSCPEAPQTVKLCSALLKDPAHVKCFQSKQVDPMQAFERCVRMSCGKGGDEQALCLRFKTLLEACPGDKKLLWKVQKTC